MGSLPAAQGGRALHPRQGNLRRRHQAARHAVRRDGAQPLRARPDQVDQQGQGAGGAGRRRGADRRRPEAGEAALDAHARRRRAGGAGGQEGLLPDAGSRDGDRQRSLQRRRRRGRGGSRLRGAAGDRRSAQVDGAGRADHPRGHRRQGQRRSRQAHASQSHLHLGGGRQGRHRRGVRQRRGDGQAKRSSTRACIRARWRPAAAWPRSTRSPAS